MHDQQNGALANHAKGDEALLFIVYSIHLGESVRIVKHQRGGLEAHAVFAPVLPILLFIPFKAHGLPLWRTLSYVRTIVNIE